jgi:tetratricopeptide (TPR) repeat protein
LDSALKYLPSDNSKNLQDNFNALVQLYFLKNDFRKVIELNNTFKNSLTYLSKKSYSNTHAWTSYRIAASYQAANDLSNALAYYKRAAELAPYQLDMINKYATALSISGNIKDAKYYYEQILSEYPKHVSALTNLGFIYLSNERNADKAASYYEKALELNPDYEPALLNKAGLYLYLGKNMEAKQILERILKLNPQNVQAKQVLQQLKTSL